MKMLVCSSYDLLSGTTRGTEFAHFLLEQAVSMQGECSTYLVFQVLYWLVWHAGTVLHL